jgi:gas vesicle protein
MNTKKMFIGILSGLITGAVIGVLFAPHKGSNTRKRIMRQSDNYSDVVKEKVNEYAEVINDKFEKAKKDISDYTDLVMGKITEIKRAKKATMN